MDLKSNSQDKLEGKYVGIKWRITFPILQAVEGLLDILCCLLTVSFFVITVISKQPTTRRTGGGSQDSASKRTGQVGR